MVLSNWKKTIILDMKDQIEKNGKILHFIHTPKCAGSYASQYFKILDIKNNGHSKIIEDSDAITFTIIRDPITRFESFLNYRLNERSPRSDFSPRLRSSFYNKNTTLDQIIKRITYDELLELIPYQSLVYWSQNVDLLITIDELDETLQLFGYKIDDLKFDKRNVSLKKRGILNEESISILSSFYKQDILLYNHWTRKDE